MSSSSTNSPSFVAFSSSVSHVNLSPLFSLRLPPSPSFLLPPSSLFSDLFPLPPPLFLYLLRQVRQLRAVFESVEAKEKELVWLKGQTSGEFDDARIVDAAIGERQVRMNTSTKSSTKSCVNVKRLTKCRNGCIVFVVNVATVVNVGWFLYILPLITNDSLYGRIVLTF